MRKLIILSKQKVYLEIFPFVVTFDHYYKKLNKWRFIYHNFLNFLFPLVPQKGNYFLLKKKKLNRKVMR